MKFTEYLNETKMTDDECLDACKTLVENGDTKAKACAQSLIAYYKENSSFHPNQIAGLQNIMKNSSLQLAEARIDGKADIVQDLKDNHAKVYKAVEDLIPYIMEKSMIQNKDLFLFFGNAVSSKEMKSLAKLDYRIVAYGRDELRIQIEL